MKSSLKTVAAGVAMATLFIGVTLAADSSSRPATATSPQAALERLRQFNSDAQIDREHQRILDQLEAKRKSGKQLTEHELKLEKEILEFRRLEKETQEALDEADKVLKQAEVLEKAMPKSVGLKAKTSTTSSSASTSSAPAKTTIAYIRMAGEILESPPLFTIFDDSYMTTRDWLQRLAKARNDKDVQAVCLEIDGCKLSWAQAQEIAAAVKRLAEVKPVYTFVVEPSATHYLVASAGKEVIMEPSGCIMITGLGIEMTYMRGTLDKLGIKPQMIQVGKFKGASEPLMNDKPSPEVVEMYNWLLDDLYDQLCSGFADNRGLQKQQIKDAIDEGPLSAPDALKFKFVDKLVSKIDWRSHVMEKFKDKPQASFAEAYGAKEKASLDAGNPFAMMNMLLKGPPRDEPRTPTIALVCADGMIVSGRSSEGMFGGKMMGSRTMVDALEEVRKDDRIKAVVFRVDSPGGSAMASEEIYQAVRKCAQSKPVIVSISSVGASGGYYIALGGTSIMADPSGIVGSVGVVSGKLALSGLMDKIGVTTYEMKRGKNAGLLLSREWDEREQAVMTRLATQTYDTFVTRVKDSRKDKIKDIDKVVQGRVFTARQAAANGLIDKVGGVKEAFQAAQEAAGLKDAYYIVTLPRPRGLSDLLAGIGLDDQEELAPAGIDASVQDALLKKALASGKAPESVAYMLNLLQAMSRENVLTAMPYYVRIAQ